MSTATNAVAAKAMAALDTCRADVVVAVRELVVADIESSDLSEAIAASNNADQLTFAQVRPNS
ncbi:hypothetical protein [Nocardia sp. NPDC059239]|uniref:hypothetical protein n=1 Tax=Nocardia sp. NPDC059239 TaxID=3346785 RepID=UPI00369C5FE7